MKRLIFAASLFALQMGASAQAATSQTGVWGATTTPSSFEDGTTYCMLWFSDEYPMMNFMARKNGMSFSVASDAFQGLPDKGMIAGYAEFGEEKLAMGMVKKPAPQEIPGLIVAGIPVEQFDTVAGKMALRSTANGSFTISVLVASTRAEFDQVFPLNSVAGDIAAFNECREKL